MELEMKTVGGLGLGQRLVGCGEGHLELLPKKVGCGEGHLELLT